MGRRHSALYAGIGTAVWIGAVASGMSGWYIVALLACGVVLGWLDAATPHLKSGLWLVVPALVLAWWTAPRGDNDGLWLLVFPLLVVMGALAAGCHWLGSRVGHEPRGLRAS